MELINTLAGKVWFKGKECVIEDIRDERVVEVLNKTLELKAWVDEDGLHIELDVGAKDRATDVYIRIIKILTRGFPELLEKFGLRHYEILGYEFFVLLKEYSSGIEDELLTHPLSQLFDIATLPNKNGYYFSTIYGIDNINVPILMSFGKLFFDELKDVVSLNPSLEELAELKEISRSILRLERLGDGRLVKLAKNAKKLEELEKTLMKISAIRYVLTNAKDIVLVSKVLHEEVQKVRRIGNGLCIYLGRKLRSELGIHEGDFVDVKLLEKGMLIRKLNRK